MIHDIEYETMPRQALEAIQFRRLTTTPERVYGNVPFFSAVSFKRLGLFRTISSAWKI